MKSSRVRFVELLCSAARSDLRRSLLRILGCESLEERTLFSVTTNAFGGPQSTRPSSSSTSGAVGSQGVEPIDGVGNNLANPTLGAAGTNFSRIAAARYGDGISSPNGQNLPSARAISNLIADQDLAGVEQDLINDRSLSDWVYAWGQFIDHDIDLTADSNVPMNMPIPAGDPIFDPTGQGNLSMPFHRSLIAPGTGTSKSNPAQQVNLDTSFIDGSMIYGSDAATAAALRTFQAGRLKTSAGNLLPYNTMGLNMANNLGLPQTSLFAAGDVRANENVELTNITTLFVREHNYQAALLAKQHPTWTDQQLYNGARQIVIGEIQSITYNEWLPALMGNNALTPYRGYNPKVNPSVTTEFASAAFRLHTLLADDVEFLDNNASPIASLPELPLKDNFFRPEIVALPGEVAANLKYLSSDLAQEVDEQTVDGLRNALFPDAPVLNNVEVGASDLIAADIQRGRDQGDPTYNQMRVALGERPVTSFAQITSNVQLQQQLQQVYGNVNNVELFVGLMGEDHLPGSSLGSTEQALLAKQFQALRDGDRFFYQNADPASLVNQLNNTTLAQIIERNTTITNLQSNVFFFYSNVQGTVTTGGSAGGSFGHNRSQPTPVPGATVRIIQAGEVVATTTTNAAGVYRFQQVGSGPYTIKVTPPAKGPYSNLGAATVNLSITRGQAGPNSPAVRNFTLSPTWRTATTAVIATSNSATASHPLGSIDVGSLAAAMASSTPKSAAPTAAVDQFFAHDGLQSLRDL